jgi:hypothetical protein
MSDKILGRICFEAWEPGGDWDDQDESLQEDFENGAQAVVAHLVADMRSPESAAIFSAIQEWLYAKERERIAEAMLAREARGMTPCFLPAVVPDYARWIRAGGKP